MATVTLTQSAAPWCKQLFVPDCLEETYQQARTPLWNAERKTFCCVFLWRLGRMGSVSSSSQAFLGKCLCWAESKREQICDHNQWRPSVWVHVGPEVMGCGSLKVWSSCSDMLICLERRAEIFIPALNSI